MALSIIPLSRVVIVHGDDHARALLRQARAVQLDDEELARLVRRVVDGQVLVVEQPENEVLDERDDAAVAARELQGLSLPE
jgi:hypothetical protein